MQIVGEGQHTPSLRHPYCTCTPSKKPCGGEGDRATTPRCRPLTALTPPGAPRGASRVLSELASRATVFAPGLSKLALPKLVLVLSELAHPELVLSERVLFELASRAPDALDPGPLFKPTACPAWSWLAESRDLCVVRCARCLAWLAATTWRSPSWRYLPYQ